MTDIRSDMVGNERHKVGNERHSQNQSWQQESLPK